MMEESNPEILTSNKSRQSQTATLTLLIRMYFPGMFQRKMRISAVKQVYHIHEWMSRSDAWVDQPARRMPAWSLHASATLCRTCCCLPSRQHNPLGSVEPGSCVCKTV